MTYKPLKFRNGRMIGPSTFELLVTVRGVILNIDNVAAGLTVWDTFEAYPSYALQRLSGILTLRDAALLYNTGNLAAVAQEAEKATKPWLEAEAAVDEDDEDGEIRIVLRRYPDPRHPLSRRLLTVEHGMTTGPSDEDLLGILHRVEATLDNAQRIEEDGQTLDVEAQRDLDGLLGTLSDYIVLHNAALILNRYHPPLAELAEALMACDAWDQISEDHPAYLLHPRFVFENAQKAMKKN